MVTFMTYSMLLISGVQSVCSGRDWWDHTGFDKCHEGWVSKETTNQWESLWLLHHSCQEQPACCALLFTSKIPNLFTSVFSFHSSQIDCLFVNVTDYLPACLLVSVTDYLYVTICFLLSKTVSVNDYLSVWLTDRQTDWLADGQTVWLTDWQTDGRTDDWTGCLDWTDFCAAVRDELASWLLDSFIHWLFAFKSTTCICRWGRSSVIVLWSFPDCSAVVQWTGSAAGPKMR